MRLQTILILSAALLLGACSTTPMYPPRPNADTSKVDLTGEWYSKSAGKTIDFKRTGPNAYSIDFRNGVRANGVLQGNTMDAGFKWYFSPDFTRGHLIGGMGLSTVYVKKP